MDSEENLDWDPGTVLPATAATNAGVGMDREENLDWDPGTVLPATAATNAGV